MAGRARAHLLVACTVLLCREVFGAAFVTTKHKTLGKAAKDKEVKVCKDIEPIKMDADERKNIKEDLVDASGIYDAMLKAMKQSSSSDELATNMGNEVDPGGLVPKAGPLIAFFMLLPVYFCICCWTCCPCCKCCLCCRKERKFSFGVKLIFVVILGILIFCVVLAGFLSLRGFGSMNEGFKATSCTASELVSSIMNGQGTLGQADYFDGMLNTLGRFDTLKKTLTDKDCAAIPSNQWTPALNPDCFLHLLKSQLDDTKKIDRAVVVVTETLGLLVTMMSPASGNLDPKESGASLHHYCLLCTHLSDPLQKVRDALGSSVSQALRDARKSVQDQLGGTSLKSLQDSFDTAGAPLTGMTDLIQTSLGPFVEEDQMDDFSKQMDAQGALASVALIFCGLLIAACGGTSITAWMCLEKNKKPSVRRLANRCACCTWNSGCVYILFAFFIGGLLMVVTMVMSSLCLFMEDMVLTPDLLDDVSRAMGISLDSDPNSTQIPMLKDILGECFKPNNPVNPLLLQILKVKNSSGIEITMDQMIVGNTKDQINAQFDKIGGSTTSPPKFADNRDMKDLIGLLRNTTISKTMIPNWADTACAGTAPPTRCTVITDRGTPVQAAFAGSPMLPAGYAVSNADRFDATLGSQNIEGLQDFVAAMNTARGETVNTVWGHGPFASGSWKTDVQRWSGGQSVTTCTAHPGCDAATYVMKLKHKLIVNRPSPLYTCSYFGRSPTKCLSAHSNTRNAKPCTEETGPTGQKFYTMPKYDAKCNLDTLTNHFVELSHVLENAITDLDTVTASVMSGITVTMKGAVDSFVLDEITKISTGLTCGVFGEKYWKFLDGMCYRGVWGMRAMASAYSATAGLTFFVVLLIYVVWRISLDNSKFGDKDFIEKYEGEGEGNSQNAVNEVMVK